MLTTRQELFSEMHDYSSYLWHPHKPLSDAFLLLHWLWKLSKYDFIDLTDTEYPRWFQSSKLCIDLESWWRPTIVAGARFSIRLLVLNENRLKDSNRSFFSRTETYSLSIWHLRASRIKVDTGTFLFSSTSVARPRDSYWAYFVRESIFSAWCESLLLGNRLNCNTFVDSPTVFNFLHLHRWDLRLFSNSLMQRTSKYFNVLIGVWRIISTTSALIHLS